MKDYRDYGRMAAALLLFGTFQACGDGDSSSFASREFGQGVDLIVYRPEFALVSVDIKTMSGSSETLSRRINLTNAEGGKDAVSRIIENSLFKLVVNGEEAMVAISSQENISHNQTISENSPECSLRGTSDVEGQATSLGLDFVWKLSASLDGGACDEFRTKFSSFLESEMNRFHLKSVRDLLGSADLLSDHRQSVRVRVELRGVRE